MSLGHGAPTGHLDTHAARKRLRDVAIVAGCALLVVIAAPVVGVAIAGTWLADRWVGR